MKGLLSVVMIPWIMAGFAGSLLKGNLVLYVLILLTVLDIMIT